jgi:DNA transformation protein
MTVSTDLLEFVKDQMAGLGAITVRRIFGGAGLYANSRMFALLSKDDLYFKADESTRRLFEAEGLGSLIYLTKNGPRALRSFWRAPARCLDDPDEMMLWCRRGYEVAGTPKRLKRTGH